MALNEVLIICRTNAKPNTFNQIQPGANRHEGTGVNKQPRRLFNESEIVAAVSH